MVTRIALPVLVCVALLMAFLYGKSVGSNSMNSKWVEQEAITQQLHKEQLDAKQMEINKVGREYAYSERSRQDRVDKLLAGYESANKRLYVRVNQLQDHTGRLTDNLRAANVEAELSRADAEFLIGESIRADEWIKGLQDTITKLTNKD